MSKEPSTFAHSIRRAIFGALTVLTFSCTLSVAYADSCSDLQTQLRSLGRGSARNAGPEVAQLSRQLTAIRGLERQRQCSAGRLGFGFFSPCRDLAMRRTAVQRQIDRSSKAAGTHVTAIRARLATLGVPPVIKCATRTR